MTRPPPEPAAGPRVRRGIAALGLLAVLCHCGPGPERPASLRAAVLAGDAGALGQFTESGAIDRPGEDGRTALQLAAELGRAEALEILLAAGADANAPGPSGLSRPTATSPPRSPPTPSHSTCSLRRRTMSTRSRSSSG